MLWAAMAVLPAPGAIALAAPAGTVQLQERPRNGIFQNPIRAAC